MTSCLVEPFLFSNWYTYPSNATTVGTTQFQFHTEYYIFFKCGRLFFVYTTGQSAKGRTKKKNVLYPWDCAFNTPFVVNSLRQKTTVPPIDQPWKSRHTNHKNFSLCSFFFYRFLSDRIYKSLYDWTAAVPVRDDSNVVAVVWITNQGKIHFHCVDVNWQSMPLVSDKFFFLLFLHNQQNFKIYIFFFFFSVSCLLRENEPKKQSAGHFRYFTRFPSPIVTTI